MKYRSRTRTEQGFTLVEVLVTVVLMGVVVVPLATAMVEALNLLPTASGRTNSATSRNTLLLAYANDVAEANSINFIAATNPTIKCQANGATAELADLRDRNNAVVATYWLIFGANGAVSVGRSTDTSAAHATSLLGEYCVGAESVAYGSSVAQDDTTLTNESIDVILSLRDSRYSQPDKIILHGLPRVTQGTLPS